MPDYDSCTNISLNISKIIVERLASITMYLFFLFVCLPVYLLKYTFGRIYSSLDSCWSWNSNILPTSWEELTHWKRPWCWEGLGAGGEGDNRGWDGWMASRTRWTWVWVNSRSWWWTGRPGVLQFMGSQRVRCNWATELNWTVFLQKFIKILFHFCEKYICECPQLNYIFNMVAIIWRKKKTDSD